MLSTSHRLPPLLALLAGLLMIAITGLQGYRFWQSVSAPSPGAPASAEPVSKRQAPPSVNLADLTLFGQPGQAGGETSVNTENLPETNLKLFLRGVMAASGDFPGSALVEDAQGKTDVFLVGDTLPGNATLKSVFANRIIIERSGKLENLYFPDTDDTSGLAMTTSEPDSEPAPAAEAPTPSPAASGGDLNDDQRREEIRRRLELLRERLRNNG
ncbi:type II secretion system protein N [Marinobacter sp. C2H3]|uniref:type II secretion system protein N n=1 Tax=Marinobacter sp. C2H3 TaxID=3119003 RepID=UPI00300F5937